MRTSTCRTCSSVMRAALAVVLACGGLQAANLLSATPGTVALTCNTLTGPGTAAKIVVKPVATLTTNTIAVTLGPLNAGWVVVPPSSTVLNAANQSQGLTYSVSLAPGCAGVTNGAATLRFVAGGVSDVPVSITATVTAAASALVASPVTVTCTRNAGSAATYTPGPAQAVSVTSAAAGGTPFVVDTSTVPAWLAITPASGGTAASAGIPLTVTAVSPCGTYAAGSSNSTSVHLKNQPAPDALLPVTLQIIGPSPLTASPASPSLSYTKGSGTPASVDVALSSTGSAATSFKVDTASLPGWLTLDGLTGATPKTLHFTTTNVADSMAQGTYTTTIRVQAPGSADLSLQLRLAISNPAPKLLVLEGAKRDLVWTAGQPLPVAYVTVASSGSAIPYSIVTGGPLAPIVAGSSAKGFAYSYDTAIPVTFAPGAFAAAEPGAVLSGTVSITWGTPAATTVVTFNITVQAPGATLLALTPNRLPTAAPGETFTVALSGSGFIVSSDPVQRTLVGIVSGGALVANANLAAVVLNPSNIILTVTVPATADPLLPFSPTGPGGTVILGVCNPSAAACTTPTGTATLTIGPNPVIQAVTSASAFLQVAPPQLASVAPYDMISLFGANFCISAGTGCTGDQIVHGMPDPLTRRYPVSLSPDDPNSVQRFVTVVFQTHATPPVPIAKAPLLFATNEQINLLVPSALSAYVGRSVDLVVNFGAPPPGTMLSSAPFAVRVAAADPGILTVGSDGQGEGAILAADWSVVTSGNEAALRSNPADSDVVQIYMTGLGMPDSTADIARAGTGWNWPADCVSTASYLSALNLQTSATAASLDGAMIDSGLLNSNRLAPCLAAATSIPTVTIGGQPATVTYAGWAPDAVAGQYQVNVRLPGSAAGTFTSAAGVPIAAPLTGPVKLPVVVAVRNLSSQPGVTIWVAPRLKVTGPASAGLHGTAGAAWPASGSQVTASGGKAPYQYAVTVGALPAGLTLDTASGAITGASARDAKGSYVLTVTVTDAAASPLTGSVTFTLTID